MVIAGGTGGQRDPRLTVLLQEAFRHCKVLGTWGDGAQVLTDAGIDTSATGVLLPEATGQDDGQAARALAAGLVPALGMHRAWERAGTLTTA